MENETFILDAVRLFPWKFSQEQFSCLTGTDSVAAHQWNHVHLRHDLFKVNEAQ